MSVDLRSLIGKLNDTTRGALESAAGLCLSRTHYDIEIEHFLLKLLEAPDTDFASILPEFGIDRTRLTAELSRSLDKLKTGNARTPAFIPLSRFSRLPPMRTWPASSAPPAASSPGSKPKRCGRNCRCCSLLLRQKRL